MLTHGPEEEPRVASFPESMLRAQERLNKEILGCLLCLEPPSLSKETGRVHSLLPGVEKAVASTHGSG